MRWKKEDGTIKAQRSQIENIELRLNNQRRETTDKAREEWWEEQCDELEKLHQMEEDMTWYIKD